MSATNELYVAGGIKRERATRVEMEARYDAIYELCREFHPATVRNIYYRAVVAKLVPKTEAGYAKVQRATAILRRAGRLPYDWIVDNHRWARRPNTWGSLGEFATAMNSLYRRDIWRDMDERVEVWCESDSIAGVLVDVTYGWGVSLFPVSGFSSMSFTYSAAKHANAIGKPVAVLYIGDHDKAGLGIADNLRRDLEGHLEVPSEFRRIGITWDQVEEYDLPGTTPKDSRGYDYPLAVEAEAMPPTVLRDMLEQAISEYVDFDLMRATLAAEESEKLFVTSVLGQLA